MINFHYQAKQHIKYIIIREIIGMVKFPKHDNSYISLEISPIFNICF